MKRILCLFLILVLLCTASTGCTQKKQKSEETEQSKSYLTPLDLMFELSNAKSRPNHFRDWSILLNGFAEQEIRDFYGILENSTSYKEEITKSAQSWQTVVSSYQEEYGDNYNFSYRIDHRASIDAEQLTLIQEFINERAQSWKDILDKFENAPEDIWSKVQYASELSPENRTHLLQAMEGIYNAYANAQVIEGYQLTYTHITNGSQLEEPIEKQDSVTVCLIGEIWVNIDRLYGEEGYTELTHARSLFLLI